LTRPREKSQTRRSPWLRLALFSVASGLFLLGYYWGNQYQRPDLSGVETAILLRPPLLLPSFSATDQAGQPLALERLQDHWSLLLIGTTASTATHDGLTLMTRIHNRLAEYRKLQDALQPILLSPDPELDSADRLLDTIHAYNPALTAAAGAGQDLRALMAVLGVQADNPSSLYLIDPQGSALALFTTDQDPAAVARDIRLILQATPGI
jgi:cytochrome oxidase Cu insertion factor (SCO1/SenC/PrrC family)